MSLSSFFGVLVLGAGLCASAQAADATVYGGGRNAFSLATGSPGELGLLKVLAEEFGQAADARMLWTKAGTGKSLSLLQEKKVDMVMVHAPAQVDKAVREGWATHKTLIGSNEFYILGPAEDPADMAQAANTSDAYRRVAAKGAKWISRGDNSGTHQKEMDLWRAAGVQHQGAAYIVTKEFMTASLRRANAERAYFMCDSSTWIMEQAVAPDLRILFRGDKALVNTYHALAAPAGATPGRETALKFIAFVASEKGQQIIRDYGRAQYREGLYNDAAYAKKFDD